MKNSILFLMFLAATYTSQAQDYLARNGKVSFHSSTPIEDIDAVNNEVVSTLNTKTGEFDFRVAILGFKFDIKDMQDHFNQEDYMDSKKYPRASFKGNITDLSQIDFTKNGTYKVTVSGNLTIKDVTRPISAPGTITVNDGRITANSTFSVNRKQFNVIGKSFVQKKIAENITVKVDVTYNKR